LPEAWDLPDRAAVGRWLRHAQATDAMIPVLRDALERAGKGWLGFYGDHQPSIDGPFKGPHATDRRTSYALWRVGGRPGERRDLSAEDLPQRWLGLMGADRGRTAPPF
jgi:hypothetical protein